MTDDQNQNQIIVILAQLTRDLTPAATDIEIKRLVNLAVRIQNIMYDNYTYNRSKVIVPNGG